MKKYILLLAIIAMSFLSIGQTSSRVPYRIPNDLDVAGGLKLRNTTWVAGGVIKFASGHFYGYTGTEWVRLDSVSAGVVPVDNIFDWRSGAYKPYTAKLLSDPGFAYFYLPPIDNASPSNNNGLYLDGSLTALSFSPLSSSLPNYASGLAPNYLSFNYSYPGYTIAGQLQLTPDGEFVIQANRDDQNTTIPIKIGAATSGQGNGEQVVVDDENQLFNINMTNVRLNKGIAGSWLALDANKNITYMTAPEGGAESLWIRDVDVIQPFDYGNKIYNIVEGATFAIKGANDTGPGLVGISTSSDGGYGESYSSNGLRGVSTIATGVSGTGGVYGVLGQTTTGTGVRGGTNTGTAVSGVASTSGTAVSGVTSTGVAGSFQTGANTSVSATTTTGLAYLGVANPSTTNTVHNVVDLRRTTSGTAAAGIGGAISFSTEQANGTSASSGVFSNVMTNVSTGLESSRFDWSLRDAGKVLATKMSLSPTGKLTVDSLRLTSGSPNKWLALDANLNVKYMDEPAGGIGSGIYDSIYWRRLGSETEGVIYPKQELDKVRLGTPDNYAIISGDSISFFDNPNDSESSIWPGSGGGINVKPIFTVLDGSNVVFQANPSVVSVTPPLRLMDGTPDKWLALNDQKEVVYMNPPSGYIPDLGYVERETIVTSGTSDSLYSIPYPTGSTVYINPNFSGSPQNGTISNPYSSWSQVTPAENTTYLQLRGTTYVSSTYIMQTTLNNIMIGAYGDTTLPRPIIQATYSSSLRLFQFGGLDPIIKDMDLRNANFTGYGVFFKGGPSNIGWVYNTNIEGFSFAIGVQYGTTDNVEAYGGLYVLHSQLHKHGIDGIDANDLLFLEVAYSEIYDSNWRYWLGWQGDDSEGGAPGDAIQVSTGGVSNSFRFLIHHNRIDRSSTGHKFCIIFGAQSQDLSGSIFNNVISGSYGILSVLPASGIYLQQSTKTMYVYNNVIKDCQNAIYTLTGGTVVAYNNLTSNTNRAFASASTTTGAYKAYNNVFYNYATSAISGIGTGSSTNATVSKNNIFIPASLTVPAYYNTGSGVWDSDYNSFSGYVTSTRDLTSWKTYSSMDLHSSTADPQLTDVSKGLFRPKTGSWVLGAGTTIADFNYDFDGSIISSPWSIGAYDSDTIPVIGGTTSSIIDSVLVVDSTPFVIGDYDAGNYTQIGRTGNISLHGTATLDVNFEQIPIAYGANGDVQVADNGLLRNVSNFSLSNSLLSTPGNIKSAITTLAANATTFSVSTNRTVITGANSVATVLGDLTGESSAIGAYITIVCGSVTNATTINDSGSYILSAVWAPNSIGDNITLLVAADNTYYEVSRSNN